MGEVRTPRARVAERRAGQQQVPRRDPTTISSILATESADAS
jgi:hypothetical protein